MSFHEFFKVLMKLGKIPKETNEKEYCDKIDKRLKQLGYWPDCENYVDDRSDTIYTLQFNSNGTVSEYRRGKGKGCFDVLDEDYDSIEDFLGW